MVGKIKWGATHPDQIDNEEKLIHWIVDGLKAYDTVEYPQFCEFINSLNKRFTILSEKQIKTKLITDLSDKIQFHVKKAVDLHSADGGYFSITTDIRSSLSRDSFISFTLGVF